MLAQRIATAVLLIAAFLAALYLLPPNAWIAVAALVLAIGAWEWGAFARLSKGARIAYAALMTLAGLVLALLFSLTSGRTGIAEGLVPVYACAALFWVLVVPAWLRRMPVAPARGAILLIGWIVLVPTFLALIHLRNIQPSTLLGFMMVVWIADIAAYFAGRRFGRRKLAPRVSPGKTWEGFYGAMIATALYAFLWLMSAPQHTPSMVRDLSWPAAGMLGLIAVLAVLSVLGDLFESAMKRQAGLKDSGAILPGHGGVLDRIDALTSVLPVAALVSLL